MDTEWGIKPSTLAVSIFISENLQFTKANMVIFGKQMKITHLDLGVSVIHSGHNLQSYLYSTTNFPPRLRTHKIKVTAFENLKYKILTARQLTFSYYHLTFPVYRYISYSSVISNTLHLARSKASWTLFYKLPTETKPVKPEDATPTTECRSPWQGRPLCKVKISVHFTLTALLSRTFPSPNKRTGKCLFHKVSGNTFSKTRLLSVS